MSEHDFAALVGLEINERIQQEFNIDGIAEPTAVQELAIPAILAGKHTVLHSGTGTGKTLGYLLPILQRLQNPEQGRCVVMTPNPELAMQSYRVANRYKDESITTASITPNVTAQRQKERLNKSTRIVIGTSGRILELYANKKMKNVTTIVLDEPDPILTSKGGDFLREILSRPEPKVQLVIATATLGPQTILLIEEIMKNDYVLVKPEIDPINTQIKHRFISVKGETGKDVSLARFIEENRCERCIVFANQPQAIRHLYRYLNEHKLKAVSISRERNRDQCKQAIEEIKSAKARVIITTDAAARGMDLPQIDWVLHYDLPNTAQGYVHRAGRTGRAGNTGTSLTILADKERAKFKKFCKALAIEAKPFRRQR
ncbi:MAG: DEAD/DEAH box helicase [Myxococcota bacterium]|jgi:superfamily II DNA/RNA helicase|nr:DEAD/DEAH box helicase [Myxococcota bacterium]